MSYNCAILFGVATPSVERAGLGSNILYLYSTNRGKYNKFVSVVFAKENSHKFYV